MTASATRAGRTAFLLFGHDLTPGFLRRIDSARRDLAGLADVHVIAWFAEGSDPPAPFRNDPGFHAYGPDRMAAMGYPVKGAAPFRLIPGNCDMLVIAFAQDHPDYDTIWQFEYDAVFTGPLTDLIGAFAGSDSALLCTHVSPITPDWHFHDALRHADGWPAPVPQAVKVFLPVFRVSTALVREIDRFYRDGGAGHHEITWPYVATACAMSVEDIGGDGPHVRPGNRNRFYTGTPFARGLNLGTFRWRPAMPRPGWLRSMLWHPVKERREPLHWYLRQRARVIRRWLRPPG